MTSRYFLFLAVGFGMLWLTGCESVKQCLSTDECGACEACTYGSCLPDPEQLNACGGCGAVPAEVCDDGVDNDCDGFVDEGCGAQCAGIDCDDASPCTDDACVPGTGCVHVANQAACDDGNPCTEGDTCALKTCQPGPNTCGCQADADCATKDDGDRCNGTLRCADQVCVKVPAVTCDPAGNTACKRNLCAPETGACAAAAVNEGGACDDGNPCTAGDSCAAGACQAGENSCECVADADCLPREDDDLCNGTLRCEGHLCLVDPATVVSCDGAQDTACRKNLCNPRTGACAQAAINESGACDDGTACTSDDACAAGACVGAPVVCQDGTGCTDDSCDPVKGCVFTNNTDACEDGNPCTETDTCTAGACVPGLNACECSVDGDCSAREDGDLCNGTLHCQDRKCVVDAPTVVVCDTAADTTCRKNTCVPATGLCAPAAINEGGACDDDSACTTADTCQAGVCAGKSQNRCPEAGAAECRLGQVRTCLADGQGCLDWSGYQACPTGACLDESACEPCPESCTPDAKRCADTSVETCAKQPGGCYAWSQPLACGFGANSYPTCQDGVCGIGCNGGFKDCDTQPGNGCEIRTDTDLANCGACGHACGIEGGTASCQTGVCSIACDPGRDDCDGENGDGCEIWLDWDGQHCGRCDHDCLGGGCSEGMCQPVALATGQAAPWRVAVDADTVYWTTEGTEGASYTDGTVMKVAKTGGNPQTLASYQVRPVAIAVDDGYVYYTTLGYPDVAYNYPNGTVNKVTKAGTGNTVLAYAQQTPWGVIVDSYFDFVFWCNGGTYHESNDVLYYDNNGSVWRMTKSGASKIALATNQQEPSALAYTGWYGNDGPELVFTRRGGFYSSQGGIGLITSNGYVYDLATAQPWPMMVASDGDAAYYKVHGGGVRRVSLFNGQDPLILDPTDGGNMAEGLVVDDTHVYWGETGNATIYRVQKTGGTKEPVVFQNAFGVRGMAQDDLAIYYTTEYSGTVMKLAK